MYFTYLLFSLVLATASIGSPIPQFSGNVLNPPSSSANSSIASSTAGSDSTAATDVASSTATAFTVYTTFPASLLSSVMATLSTANLTATAVSDSTALPTPTTNDTSSADATATASTVTPAATDGSLTPTSTATDGSNSDPATVTVTASSAALPSASFVIPLNIPQACLANFTAAPYYSTYVTATGSAPLATASANSTADSPLSSLGGNATVSTSATDSAASLASTTVSATDSILTGASAASSSASSIASSVSASSVSVSSASASSAAPPSATAAGLNLTTGADNETLSKRIAQADLPDIAQSWQDLCLVSNGDVFTDEPCVQLAGVNGINALLANADPCAQQDNADAMVDYAKSPGVNNTDALIANAITYRQHPRNSLNINGVVPSTPYCQRAPRNPELNGLVNAQLPGVNPGIFGGPNFGLVAFGDPSSCPFGTSPDATSCGCS